MSDTITITGTIKNARFYDIGNRQVCAGNIYGDIHGRFADGSAITTSAIEDIAGDIVTTSNSVYKVERRAV